MHKNRLEAFTNGVLSIVNPIMVLEIKVPHGDSLDAHWPLWPKFLSFEYVGIYWTNHHHSMQAAKSVDGAVRWTKLNLLFWLSLLPFSTGRMGENHFAQVPILLYGLNLLLCALAYFHWARSLVAHYGQDSALVPAIGKDIKGKISLLLYVLGMAVAQYQSTFGFAVFALVALLWLVPGPRMHRAVEG